MANDFDRKTKGKGKGNSLPEGLVFYKRNDHHDKTKDADRYRKCVSFGEILFHLFGKLKMDFTRDL
jgi:hypothetical protein